MALLNQQPNGSQPIASPRRKALGAHASATTLSPTSSQNQNSQGFGSLGAPTINENYFSLPELRTLSTLLAKLPSELSVLLCGTAPLPGKRRPAGAGQGSTSTFSRAILNACAIHDLLKECLLEAVLDYCDSWPTESGAERYVEFILDGGEARKVLGRAREAVEEARKSV